MSSILKTIANKPLLLAVCGIGLFFMLHLLNGGEKLLQTNQFNSNWNWKLPKKSDKVPKVSGINVTHVNLTTVVIHWDPIPKEQVRGVLLGYVVTAYQIYHGNVSPTYIVNKTSVVLTDIWGVPTYKISVLGYTAHIRGPILYHNFTSAPIHRSYFDLQVNFLNATAAILSWDPRRLVESVIMEYIVTLWGYTTKRLQTYKTKNASIVLTNLEELNAVDVRGYTSNGTEIYSYKHLYVPPIIHAPKGLNVTIVNFTTLIARWDPIPKDQVHGILLGYKVGIKFINYNTHVYEDQWKKTNKTSIMIKNSDPKWSKLCRVSVAGYSTKGEGPSSSFYETSIKQHKKVHFITTTKQHSKQYSATTPLSTLMPMLSVGQAGFDNNSYVIYEYFSLDDILVFIVNCLITFLAVLWMVLSCQSIVKRVSLEPETKMICISFYVLNISSILILFYICTSGKKTIWFSLPVIFAFIVISIFCCACCKLYFACKTKLTKLWNPVHNIKDSVIVTV